MAKNVDFGDAIKALKEGKRVSREGWNGKGMFVFMRPGDKLSVNLIVHQVKSLPNSVKGYFGRCTGLDLNNRLDGDDLVEFLPYFCMKAADGSIVNGWLASQTDMLAEDWCILD